MMQGSEFFDPLFPLTPSELFFLSVQDVEIGSKVSFRRKDWPSTSMFDPRRPKPGSMMIVVALLANEQLGFLHLETFKKRILLGLGQRRVLALFTGTPKTWPHDSLESELYRIGVASNEEGECLIYDIVYEWLQIRGYPMQKAFELVREYLCKRRFFKRIESKRIGIFRVTEYFPQEKITRYAAEQRIQLINEMLTDCKSTRLDLWELLFWEIGGAFNHRTS